MDDELKRKIAASLDLPADAQADRELAAVLERDAGANTYARELRAIEGALRAWPAPRKSTADWDRMAAAIESNLGEAPWEKRARVRGVAQAISWDPMAPPPLDEQPEGHEANEPEHKGMATSHDDNEKDDDLEGLAALTRTSSAPTSTSIPPPAVRPGPALADDESNDSSGIVDIKKLADIALKQSAPPPAASLAPTPADTSARSDTAVLASDAVPARTGASSARAGEKRAAAPVTSIEAAPAKRSSAVVWLVPVLAAAAAGGFFLLSKRDSQPAATASNATPASSSSESPPAQPTAPAATPANAPVAVAVAPTQPATETATQGQAAPTPEPTTAAAAAPAAAAAQPSTIGAVASAETTTPSAPRGMAPSGSEGGSGAEGESRQSVAQAQQRLAATAHAGREAAPPETQERPAASARVATAEPRESPHREPRGSSAVAMNTAPPPPSAAAAPAARPAAATDDTERPARAQQSTTVATRSPVAGAGGAPASGAAAPGGRPRSVEELMRAAVPTAAPTPTTTVATTTSATPGDLPERPSQGQVSSTLAPLRSAVRACAQGQTGMATVQIVIVGNGSVQTARVAGPFNGEINSCIEGVVRRAHFPAFSRPSVSIVYPFTIQPPRPGEH